jgi:hypothetical protein
LDDASFPQWKPCGLTDRSVERYIAPKTPVHVHNILLGDAEASGHKLDLVRAQVALVKMGTTATSLLRPRQSVLPDPVGIRGVSSDHPWHRFAGDQGT